MTPKLLKTFCAIVLRESQQVEGGDLTSYELHNTHKPQGMPDILSMRKLSPGSPGWLRPQESPCPWQEFDLTRLLFPTSSVSPAAKLVPQGREKEMSFLPLALPGDQGTSPIFLHMLGLSILQQGCAVVLALMTPLSV